MLFFAPNRFVGYKNSNMTKHTDLLDTKIAI